MDTKINQAIKSVLLMFGDKYFIGEIINKQKVIHDLDNYDKELMTKMLSNDVVKSNFTTAINDAIIFNVNKLVELFETNDYWQDSYTKYSKKIGLTANGKFIDETTEVVLDFPYKDTVLKAGMTQEDLAKDDLRPDEPFLNEVIAKEEIDVLLDKKLLVNAKKYDIEGEHKVSEITEDDNLILKGNNLLALHSLKERYAGKVKLIYIDPPYNTGNDSFQYNDRFNHSAWLTFMKNRLEIARDLLTEDGSIWINIDDDESHYLKVLCDGIFERENFLANIIWQKKYTIANDAKYFSDSHDHILVYSMRKETFKLNGLPRSEEMNARYKNPDNDFRGPWMTQPLHAKSGKNSDFSYTFKNGVTWEPPRGTFPRYSFDSLKEYDNNNMIWFGKDGKSVPRLKKYLSDMGNVTPNTLWLHTEAGNNDQANKEIKRLIEDFNFSTPKPEKLLQRILHIGSDEGDLVVDFFMGSATTQAVAMKMNRRFIGIEQMDYIDTVSVPRLQKVIEGEQGGISKEVDWQGGGSFIYAELMEKNTGFLKEIIEADTMQELQAIFERMSQSPDIDFRVDLEEVKATLWEHSLEEQKKTLIKILDKNQLYFNYSEIDDAHVRELVSDSDYAFNQSFYKEVNQDG
ncbi:type III restriction endonuclease subunit M [Vagococcus penaei]|uniref:Type III restriction endonuclease subunit M n=1 Tax=Vagococcus penaei TaxID=633807 RepID=A0A1Q2D8W7_9ENTE|nr:site-specific DNA-methyltransferase [Vagococcus penaei]AQP54643.1 type III restriction endonuclease subunit M [Vagococcus penaei]RST98330.1 type III restriction endonuclease subunit M [Vagococcus penaei]